MKCVMPSNAVVKHRREGKRYLNAVTYVNVFGQQLVGHFVLVEDVIVDRRAAGR